MTSITQISEAMQKLLIDKATEAAQETGFIQRQMKVTGENFCQTVILGWLQNPEASLEELCQTGAALGLEITPQGLDQRFTPAASNCLYRVLQASLNEVIQAEEVTIPILQRFNGVYIEDSTIITLPPELTAIWSGCGGSGTASQAAVKLQVRWDMLGGRIDGPCLTNGRTHDRVASELSQPLPAGSLLIRDLGYWKLAALDELSQADCFWLSRAQAQTGFVDKTGRQWTQAAYVQQETSDSFDIPILVGFQKRIQARLVGFRVPLAVAQERRRKLRNASQREGRVPSQERLALCDWSLFVTNVPADLLAPDEILILARLRWQIELLFKLWKSHGQIDKSRSEKPWRILCELYAKLIGMIIQHWSFLLSNWTFPNRSLVKAAATIRRHALNLALALSDCSRLTESLAILQACLAHGARINKSVKTPRTFQLLLALAEVSA